MDRRSNPGYQAPGSTLVAIISAALNRDVAVHKATGVRGSTFYARQLRATQHDSSDPPGKKNIDI